ncbi:MAG TPA: hypothetical protein VHG93_06620 [Longimicrobium sp.]|nr:hypothetical protein [Longimicrobium sp.]
MRESDAPPPGDPSMRRSRPWALLIIAAILVFLVWFVLENRETDRNRGAPVVVPGATG